MTHSAAMAAEILQGKKNFWGIKKKLFVIIPTKKLELIYRSFTVVHSLHSLMMDLLLEQDLRI